MPWSRLGSYGRAVGLQVFGAVAGLLGTIVLARRFGAEGQGLVSLFKSSLDFIVAIGSVGLPQSFIFMINSGRLPLRAAVAFSLRHLLVFALITIVAAVLWRQSGWATPIDSAWALPLAIGSVTLTVYALFRGLCITDKGAVAYGAVTAAPAALSLAVFALWPSSTPTLVYAWSVISAVSAVIAVACLVIRPTPALRSSSQSIGAPGTIYAYGIWSFVSETATTLSGLMTLSAVKYWTRDLAAVGQLSLALFALQSCLVPFNMLGPLLFNSWSKTSGAMPRGARPGLILSATLVAALAIPAGLIGALLAPIVVPTVFGPQFTPAVVPTQMLLAGLYPFCVVRVLAPGLYAEGGHREVAAAYTVRLGIVVAGCAASRFGGDIVALAAIWLIAEVACLGCMMMALRRATGVSLLDLAGLRPSWMSALWRRKVPGTRAGDLS